MQGEKAGGLCMMWINSIDVKPIRLKGVEAWEHLNALLESIQEPWVCFGDFNLTISDEEKLGGRRGNSSRQNFLQDMMFELGAIDLGYSGNQFTWSNNRWGRNAIKERLDRGIASMSWRLKFPKATIYHLGAIKSDHCPIVLDTNPVDTFYPRPFRFEAAWTRDPRKQYNTQMALKKWNREVFGHCQHRIDSLMLQIQQIQQNEATEENHRNEACLQYELSEWLLRNEILWRQKSRETWLREDRKEIRKHFLTHFTSQFCEEEVDFPTNLEELIPNSISDSENEELCRIPTPQEIKKTLFDMSAQKSPGPDGLPTTQGGEQYILGTHSQDSFNPSRGLRQGDPLSPYLFILCQETLSRLIEKQLSERRINGVKASIGGPAITHVMYADDIILFSKTNKKETTILNQCLDTYCTWSGQIVNRNKSGLVFSKYTPKPTIRHTKHLLQMKTLKKDAIYLGAPLFLSKASVRDFQFLKERLEAKLMGWRSKCLSWAGRCTMIKSVAQALPTYVMSTFELPNKICESMDALNRRRFWWKPNMVNQNGKYMAWNSWDKLCQTKRDGGLGFRKTKEVNMALIAKLSWMVASKRNSICMELLRKKYKVRKDWLSKEPMKTASPIWRAIEKAKKIVLKGACYMVGDGNSINIWKDPWVPWLEDFKPKPKDDSIQFNPQMVSSLIDQNAHNWKLEALEQLFDQESVEAISRIIIPIRQREDKLMWIHDHKGVFTVKSAYKLNHDNSSGSNAGFEWQRIWKLKAHERTKMLIWRIGANVLPTKERIAQRMPISDTSCSLCNAEPESSAHLFFNCTVARAIWYGGSWCFRSDSISVQNNEDIVKIVLDPPCLGRLQNKAELKDHYSLIMGTTIEAIWNLRNRVLHNGEHINLDAIVNNIESRILEYKLSKEPPNQKVPTEPARWCCPPPNVVKLNVDAAIASDFSTLAVIARDSNGNILKAWAKRSSHSDPLQAETCAILWALKLAAEESFLHILVEGDSKISFDAIQGESTVPWSISSIVSNVIELRKVFVSCDFCWVGREANFVAHSLAKFAISSPLDLSCNISSLPHVVCDAWKMDLLASAR
uniref:Reverse transcriptase domain-containing protein n=1 Tax=Fagus sylvatica TaxID=28930 RepID=A0A2N9GTN8_FAGSY